MKKIGLLVFVLIFVFLTGCVKDVKGPEYFKSEVIKIFPKAYESESFYEILGAIDGFDIEDEEELSNLYLRFYIFDEESEVYKDYLENQYVCTSDYCFSAIVKKGYALSFYGHCPKQVQISSIFDELD